MLNQAYEKNALLEMEVDEKEVLQVKLQRLVDETRGKFLIFIYLPMFINSQTNFNP